MGIVDYLVMAAVGLGVGLVVLAYLAWMVHVDDKNCPLHRPATSAVVVKDWPCKGDRYSVVVESKGKGTFLSKK